jgi:hypothetical protein
VVAPGGRFPCVQVVDQLPPIRDRHFGGCRASTAESPLGVYKADDAALEPTETNSSLLASPNDKLKLVYYIAALSVYLSDGTGLEATRVIISARYLRAAF